MDKKTIIIATIKSQVALYDQLLFSPRAFCVQWTPTDRFQADLDMMETWKIQADYEELMMEKYKQSLHIMTISFLPSYQYFETFYFLQESKWLSSNMLDYFKTWYYCLQHNICYWNQRHVWVRKFLNYSTLKYSQNINISSQQKTTTFTVCHNIYDIEAHRLYEILLCNS